MKEQNRTFAENVVFTCTVILSGLVVTIGLIQLVRMAL